MERAVTESLSDLTFSVTEVCVGWAVQKANLAGL